MAEETIPNVLLCVEFEEDVLARYRDILGSAGDTQLRLVVSKSGNIVARQFEAILPDGQVVPYNLIVAMGGQEAISMAADVHGQGDEIVAGFFELRQTEDQFGYAHAINEIRRIFPRITCAVCAPHDPTLFQTIAALFQSPDEWLYFDRSEISRSELEHTILNLISSGEHARQLRTALERVEAGRQGMSQILEGTPDLLKIQSLEALYGTVVEQGARIAGTTTAILALHEGERFRYVAGCGRFAPSEETKVRFRKLETHPVFEAALNEGRRQGLSNGMVVPLAIRGKRIGVLYLDGSTQSLRDDEVVDIFAAQAAFAIENNRLRLEIEEKRAMEKELDLAARIQRSLVPRKFPNVPGLAVHGVMESAREIGGDYFDCLVIDAGDRAEMVLVIGDVAGKGVPAGLIMSEARSLIRSQVPTTPDLKKVMVTMAGLIKDDLLASPGKFLSLLLTRWRFGSERMEFCSAGHEHILHYRAGEKACKCHKSGGVVMGVPLAAFEKGLVARALRYQPGDVVLFFTDGVTEAVNRAGEMYRLERLVPTLERVAHLAPKEIVAEVLADIRRFADGADQRDDITLLAVKAL